MAKALDEPALLAETVDRLARRYPTASLKTVTEVVRELYAGFDGAPIREYVPLLIERSANIVLSERPATGS